MRNERFYEILTAGEWIGSRLPHDAPMSETQDLTENESVVREAVGRVLDGDVEAFGVIVAAYQRLIAADLAGRLPSQDVQEVAQDTFVRAYRALPGYRGEAPVRVWLLRIARHAAMDYWRRHYRRRERLFTDLDEPEQVRMESSRQQRLAEQQSDRDAQEAARERLEAALTRLSPDDRAVITLVELEDRPMAEAAKRLGCGLSAVKVRAFRARRRLRVILEQLQPEQKENT